MKKVILIVVLLMLAGCASEFDVITYETVSDDVVDSEEVVEEVNEMVNVKVETSKGDFVIELYTETPISSANFEKLVKEGFYDGLTFHRYEPNFVIQGGDPSGDGTGGSSENIELELTGGSHSRGTVGMARSNDPNSASSQFFVNLADNTFLDSGYAVFGKVTEGMDVVDQLRVGDTRSKVTIINS